MMRRTYAAISCRCALYILVALVLVPVLARAESVQASKQIPKLCTVIASGQCQNGWQLAHAHGSITYNVRVVDVATGETFGSGATVSAGTVVKFQFMPHQSTDIWWVGTGHGYDSPNGDWIANAARPPQGVCWSKNHFGEVGTDNDRGGYASLTVNPPEKSIAGLPDGCTTASDGVSKICTLSESGQIHAAFRFAETYGKFYGAHGANKQNGTCVGDAYNYTLPLEEMKCEGMPKPCSIWRYPTLAAAPFSLNIHAQRIPFDITVSGEQDGGKPTAPAIAGGACTVGQPYEITMTATDPDGDALRYGIDWDNDGAVDQFVPQGGTVPSGTSATASRRFQSAGEKTIAAIARDTTGKSSNWATYSFTCSVDGSTQCTGNRPADSTICPKDTIKVPPNTSWSDVTNAAGCTNARKCEYYPRTSSGECTGDRPTDTIVCPDDMSGLTQDIPWRWRASASLCTNARKCEYYPASDSDECDNGLNRTRYLSCTCPPHQEIQGSVCAVIGPDVTESLRAAPALVRPGDPTWLFWGVANVQSCTVVGNGQSWTGFNSPAGGQKTEPITKQTTFTMTCDAYEGYEPPSFSQSATVNVIPQFRER